MSTTRRRILDSHVHLWPAETANEAGHRWLPPDMPLAKPQLPLSYISASNDLKPTDVQALVFIETDVRYETTNEKLSSWAKGPLDEIAFVRQVVEGDFGEKASSLVQAIVPWAPLDKSTATTEEYLILAKAEAGYTTWKRVKGFRFLLQQITNEDQFRALVFSDHFINNLKLLGRKDLSFDIGVDQRSVGSWQLEYIAQAMSLAHQGVDEDDKVCFIINHLCKPAFSNDGTEFESWCSAISAMSNVSRTYMKLSGAFVELPSDVALSSPSDIAAYMRPWIQHVFKCFGPERIMFGSDWPVCNLRDPSAGDSWVAWRDVVELIVEDEAYGLSDRDKDRIWFGTGAVAYGIHESS